MSCCLMNNFYAQWTYIKTGMYLTVHQAIVFICDNVIIFHIVQQLLCDSVIALLTVCLFLFSLSAVLNSSDLEWTSLAPTAKNLL